jgi:hypothetical protein
MALLAAGMGFAGSASATLLDRGPNLVYDDVLNITWTRDANLPDSSGLTWAQANAFAANLVFGGFDDWRLPYASVAAGAGPAAAVLNSCTGAGGTDEVACRDNEMGYMFYYNLDGNLGDNKTGNQTAVGGEMLTNIQPGYWSGTQFDSSGAWLFSFENGGQSVGGMTGLLPAWAVRPGDVAAIPEPETYALLLAGLGLMGFVARRRKKARAAA